MIKNRNFPSNNSYFAEEEIPVCEITDSEECNIIYENIFMQGLNNISSKTLYNFLITNMSDKFKQFKLFINSPELDLNERVTCMYLPTLNDNAVYPAFFVNSNSSFEIWYYIDNYIFKCNDNLN